MRISINWLKEFVNFNKSTDELSDLLTDIGLEVEGVEAFQSIKGGLKGLVIGKVLSSEQHPDADRLKVTKVDIGLEMPLQIVCGAPNVAQGQTVVVATVGTMVHPLVGDPFEIKKAKIRGVASEGMICAEDEIGLGKSHDGIMVLDNAIKVGSTAAAHFGIEDDLVLEIGLTPNRSDAYSHFGVARDLAATISFRENQNTPLCYPLLKDDEFLQIGKKPLQVSVENPIACPRYSGVVIENIKIEPSPKWLQNRLNAIGLRPINNIVDITNYVLAEYGQPLHAFDYDKIEGKKIIVKNSAEAQQFMTLDKQSRQLSANDLMICDESGGMCIAGIYGGQHSGVSDETTTIFLESAYFTASGIRKTATRLGLKTDASSHFDKGADPNITLFALKRATKLIMEIAGGQIASPFFDEGIQETAPFQVSLSWERLEQLTGIKISEAEVVSILKLLGIQVQSQNNDGLVALVPPFKADVKREVDLIEEILRIYGLNQIPIPQKINASIQFSKDIDNHKLQNQIADFLVANGFLEIMANSVTKSKHYTGNKPEELVRLISSINVELDIMRPTMIWSGLEAIAYNVNRKNVDCQFFEYGKIYQKIEGEYKEQQQLSLFLTGAKRLAHWNDKSVQTDFSYLKSLADRIFTKLGIKGLVLQESTNEDFEYGGSYFLKDIEIASFGKIATHLGKQFDIKPAVFHASFNWEAILKCISISDLKYKEVPKFPSMRRDLALLINKSITYEQIKQIAEKYGKRNLVNIELFDIFTDVKIGVDKKSYAVSFTFQDETKTLLDVDIDAVMKKLMEMFKVHLDAVIR